MVALTRGLDCRRAKARRANKRYAQQLAAVRSALATLLPEVQDWRVDGKDMRVTRRVMVPKLNDKGEEELVEEARDIPVGWLSDGERSLAAIGADIAIRLASLNEGAADPVKDGSGVVLLDEIDLHLHPQWQRRIATDLPAAFPKVQFIATSHSPQVIGETPAGRAILLHEGGRTEVLDESLGVTVAGFFAMSWERPRETQGCRLALMKSTG
jgi:hypothetical protein